MKANAPESLFASDGVQTRCTLQLFSDKASYLSF